MKNKFFFIFFMLIALAITFNACSFVSIPKKAKNFMPGFKAIDQNLKKNIAVIFLNDKSEKNIKEINSNFHRRFFENVDKICPNINVIQSEKSEDIAKLSNLPKLDSNRFDNLLLLPAARQLGLNAIVFISPSLIENKQKKDGLLWFKEYANFIVMQTKIEIYDTVTGTKLFDKLFSIEVKIKDNQPLESTENISLYNLPEIEKTIQDLSVKISDVICNTIGSEKWRSYIAKKDNDKVIIFGGENVGLNPGDILNAYENNSTITSSDGQHFFIPGGKVGTLRINLVDKNTSEAIILSGEKVGVGNHVEYAK